MLFRWTQRYVKGYGFFSFAKNLGKSLTNIVKNVLVLLQNAVDAIKTASKNAIQKTAEATGNLIGNKISNKITNLSKKICKGIAF